MVKFSLQKNTSCKKYLDGVKEERKVVKSIGVSSSIFHNWVKQNEHSAAYENAIQLTYYAKFKLDVLI